MNVLLNASRDGCRVVAELADASIGDIMAYNTKYGLDIDTSLTDKVLLIKSVTLSSPNSFALLDDLFANLVTIANSREIIFIGELDSCYDTSAVFYNKCGFEVKCSSTGSMIMMYSGVVN